MIYLDSSALVRWVVREPGWRRLGDYLRAHPTRVASRIVDIEVSRAVARMPVAGAGTRAAEVLDRLIRLELDAPLAAIAARLSSLTLRTLDAIHLASALALIGEMEAFVTYDERLATAARAVGLQVAAPGG